KSILFHGYKFLSKFSNYYIITLLHFQIIFTVTSTSPYPCNELFYDGTPFQNQDAGIRSHYCFQGSLIRKIKIEGQFIVFFYLLRILGIGGGHPNYLITVLDCQIRYLL